MTFGSKESGLPKRATGQAIRRGLRCRCPNCGEGRLFGKYLKVVSNCAVCGEDYTPNRADDLPPYITIVIVGHVIVTALLFFYTRVDIPTWAHLAIWLPATLVMTLALLQPVKGAVVGLQWALYMHGFDPRAGADAFGGDGARIPDDIDVAANEAPRPVS
jgi:uncharacterized protein (DUF983 family)